ncbi:glycoside hydrolase family 1 protein [Culicoidibacter larvae]|uniref:Glycoside hydrolase family 1 protein n=1 Tax=Culicoidibacter larvae TaxID=2579976 RepID=A0A5R8QEV4_9FIRM|nr:glycoside hydrolase family 1 protein [Culicoidibacter larvae]TLG76528.1 glycoside hydrolase family 1 protein [Culicoidibacter larvae]
MSKTYQFANNFWWGAASSATQSEGAAFEDGKGLNIFDYWYQIEPDKFHNQVPATDASTFYKNYKSDIQLMKDINLNSFRTSISWARLIPGGRGEVNPKAVDFYNNVIDELIAQGIEPFFNLYHFDMPIEMQDIGGWENLEVVEAYVTYAKTCFELFGDRVKYWFTHNEPIVPVEAGYMYQFHYPNIVDFKRAIQVAYYSQLASSMAVAAYRELQLDGKIGIILNLTPSYPRDESNTTDVKAAHICDLFFNRSFLDPSVKGEFPEELMTILKEHDHLPVYTEEELAVIKNNTVDILGVNYYQPRRVKAREAAIAADEAFAPEWFFDNYEMPGRRMNPYRGWEIYPRGIYDIAKNVQENYGNIEWYISENGMGVEHEERFIGEDGIVQDDYRIEFIQEHLEWLHQAIEEGANCKGYHLWTFIDNWSWANAYKNRYGFYRLDLATQKRTIKKSGLWMKEVAKLNRFDGK